MVDKKTPRIVFMGTPEFAVESLKALVENGYNVVGVITMPDKPAGRGYQLKPSPVKLYAQQEGLTVLQPEKLKDEGFLEELSALKADMQVVVAFRMLPEVVWSMPPKGTFNLHSSLLPQYRGAAPINWALINGEKETGVTTFFLASDIDTGSIIFRDKTTIYPSDNAGTLHDRLMVMGAKLVLKTVDAIAAGTARAIPQHELMEEVGELKPAPKIFTDDCRVDWGLKRDEVHNFIRGLSPYPAAWTELVGSDMEKPLRVKIYGSEPVEQATEDVLPGTLRTDNKAHVHVAVNDGWVGVTHLQFPGKRRLSVVDLLNGYSFEPNTRFV